MQAPEAPLSSEAFLAHVPHEEREALQRWLDQSLLRGDAHAIEHRVVHTDGEQRIVRQRAEVIRDASGAARSVDVAIFDITEWREAEAQVKYQIDHDTLTGLENRERFTRRVRDAIKRCKKSSLGLAVLSINLDRFKQINESLGHRVGDQVLRRVAERLAGCFEECAPNDEDSSTRGRVARVGGDIFSVLLGELHHVQDAGKLAWAIVDSFSEPLVCCQHELFLTTSVGIAIYPNDEVAAEALLQSAEAAMNYAKTQGRNTAQFCSPFMNTLAKERLQLETHLRRALDREELEVYYQPKVDFQTGQIRGMEALMRWHHPELGIVSPEGFIPIAEETGLILSMSEWLLRTVCEQVLCWAQSGLRCRTSVNFTAQHFHRGDAALSVRQALEETGLDPALLEIEITEGALMDDMETTIQQLRDIKELGVALAIDDFGTGYSSLSYLNQFPLDVLKIDRSFVSCLPGDTETAAIITAIISMGQSLHLEIVAEGVETEEQLEFLKLRRCDLYQGFLLSPPVPVDIATALLKAHTPAVPAP
jgi:diguanylate cyclase (GGDEF)-like protein